MSHESNGCAGYAELLVLLTQEQASHAETKQKCEDLLRLQAESRLAEAATNITPEGDAPRGLTVTVGNDAVIVTLPMDAMCEAVENCPDFAEYDAATVQVHRPKVIDREAFARGVVRALLCESEDGSTAATRMFDEAFSEAIGDGAEGIRMPGDYLE
jgi:hypothetical protein